MAERPEIDDAILDAAAERGLIEVATKPRALSARYDHHAGRVVIELANGRAFPFPPGIAQDLQAATPDQLAEIEISAAGLALHWPQIDVDFNVASLVAGIFGTAAFMDAQRREGHARLLAQTTAPGDNGRKGGRPRRSA